MPEDLLVYMSDHRIANIHIAEPVIWLTNESLATLVMHPHDCTCGMRLHSDTPGWYPIAGHHGTHQCTPTSPDFCYSGCRLVIEPINGDRLVYILGDYDALRHAWRAAWPD